MRHADRRALSAWRPTLAAGSLLLLTAAATAQGKSPDWPQWRGPARDGISAERGWSVKGKGVLWMTNVGLGYSTVSIAGGKLYTIGHDAKKQEDTLFCIDPETGLEDWVYSYPAKTMAQMHGGGSLSTPSVAGGRVFVSNREGRMFSVDAATGKELWTKDLTKTYGLRISRWGFAASPLVLDDMIVVNADMVLAFTKDGKEIWKSEKHYGDCYSTPADVTIDGRACLAVFNATGLVMLDRKSGAEIAVHPWKSRTGVNAATPVTIGNRIFISSGYNMGAAMVEASKDALKPLWDSKVMRSQMSGCVLYRDHLYGFDESTLKCLDLDGNEKWGERGLGKGALVAAGDKLVILGEKGDLVVAEASPEAYRELSRDKVLDGGVCWTTPVLWGGRVFCRNSLGDLVCVDHRSDAR